MKENDLLVMVEQAILLKGVYICHGKSREFIKILEDVNLIVVDWNQGATTFIYNRAVKNTKIVAERLKEPIENLLNHGASLDNFHLIGVSLGAHISGFIGKLFHGQLGRITGLDPAGPKFSGKPSNDRLDYTDAKFVDVIHTDTNGIDFIKCDHQRAVHFFLAAFETTCKFVSFPCDSYNDFKNGLCMDCGNFSADSCPRLGNQAKLWKKEMKKTVEEQPFRTVAYLDTSSQEPFCTYYFALSLVSLNTTISDGSISFSLLSRLDKFEHPRYYVKSKTFNNLQEVKILAQFIRDVVNVTCIFVTYLQSSDSYCSTCQYRIQSLMLKSLTYPERPPVCKYNFVLKERTLTKLQLDA
ncbi:lipase member I, partial [Sigmodon hispidus]